MREDANVRDSRFERSQELDAADQGVIPMSGLKNMTAATLHKLMRGKDPQAAEYVTRMQNANGQSIREGKYGSVRGVTITVDEALMKVEQKYVGDFRKNLRAAANNLSDCADYVSKKVKEDHESPFFVIAHMTGELVQYYKRLESFLQQNLQADASAVAKKAGELSFAKEMRTFYLQRGIQPPDFEFEMIHLKENLDDLRVGESQWKTRLIQSHSLLINMVFDVNQEFNTLERLDELCSYIEKKLDERIASEYWQGF